MEQEHPASMTARAVKQALPDRAIVTRDARVMMNTATTMFTLYLSTIAHDISTKNKRSTITLKDVLGALRETDFEHFIEPIEQCLQDTKAADARKRARKEAHKADTATGEGVDAADEVTHGNGNVEEEQEEVPMETDADLDGEQTIDEDEDVDGGDADADADEDEMADDAAPTTNSEPLDEVVKASEQSLDVSMTEETKESTP